MKRVFIGVGLALAALAAVWALRGRGLPVEMAEARVETVREYIAEDAKTRLSDEYIVDMPLTGTVNRIELEVGDKIEAGQCIVQLDTFDWEQQITAAEAQIAQVQAQVTGVDVAKPKPEDLETAQLRVDQAASQQGIATREKAAVSVLYEDAKKKFDQAKSLSEQGAISQNMYDDAKRTLDQLNQRLAAAELAESAASRGLEAAKLTEQRLRGSVDDNEFNRDSLNAQVNALKAQLEIARKNLEKTKVLAPVSGFVLEKYVEDERVLMAGTPLMKLGDVATIEIECDVLSEEVGRVDVGDAVEISGKAVAGETIIGSVKRIYPSGFMKISALGIEQQRVRTIIAFDNTNLNLRPGTSVDVRIITGESPDVVTVPERATFRHEGNWAVFAVSGGRARLKTVKVGLKNDEFAEITEGLAAGDTVVADVKNELVDGMRVSKL
ncbi:MAG: hypothetical protein AMXMBFR84_02790 [Candidatus Hydrogenedentota bacterium]